MIVAIIFSSISDEEHITAKKKCLLFHEALMEKCCTDCIKK